MLFTFSIFMSTFVFALIVEMLNWLFGFDEDCVLTTRIIVYFLLSCSFIASMSCIIHFLLSKL